MTLPTHAVKHIRNRYRKSQIIAAMFAFLTIAACFLVALSGIQITFLKKQQPPLSEDASASDLKIRNELIQQVDTLKAELAKEQSTAKSLHTKVTDLESRLAAIHKAVAPTAVSPPLEGHPIPVAKPAQSPKPKLAPVQKAAPAKTLPPKPVNKPVVKPVAKPKPAPAKKTIAPSAAPKTEPTNSAPPVPKAKQVIKPTPPPEPQAPNTPEPDQVPAAAPQSTSTKPAEPAPAPKSTTGSQPVAEQTLVTEEISSEKPQ